MFTEFPKAPVRHGLLIASLACLTLASASTGASADTPSESNLTVNGTGAAFVVPDVANVSIQVSSSGSTATMARSRSNRRTDAVLAAIRRAGLSQSDIQTAGISLDHFQAGSAGHRHRVYTASNSLSVTTNHVELVGPVIDAATAAGADSIGGPQFSFSDPSAGKAPATRAALTDARARADDAAAAVGYRITGVRSITIDPQSGGPITTQGAAAPAPAPSQKTRPPTPVSPGREEVDATVTVVYIMAPA